MSACWPSLPPAGGEPYAFTSHRGQAVVRASRGLCRYATVSSSGQEQAADLVPLALGLPLLVVSAWLAQRGSLRGPTIGRSRG